MHHLYASWPILRAGARHPGHEAVGGADGAALRPLAGLRAGQGGAAGRGGRAPRRAGAGAPGAPVGARVLAQALLDLSPEPAASTTFSSTCQNGPHSSVFCWVRHRLRLRARRRHRARIPKGGKYPGRFRGEFPPIFNLLQVPNKRCSTFSIGRHCSTCSAAATCLILNVCW